MAIILTTKDIHGLWLGHDGPRTLVALHERQRRHLAKNPAAHPPRVIIAPICAFIGQGAWRIECICREAPHTDPEWSEACCFGCGAVYMHIVFPENRLAIEELLARRPVQATRNWKEPETLESLREEQIAHGDPV